AIARNARIFLLCLYQVAKRIDSGMLISANPPVKNFFLAGLCIERPGATFVHERNWKRPVFRSEVEPHGFIRFGDKPMHFVILLYNSFAIGPVRDWIAGRQQVFSLWSENLSQLGTVVCLRGCVQSLDGLRRRRESFLRCRLSYSRKHWHRYEQSEQN